MSSRLSPGQWIGRWRLESPLGRGAYGSTWRAVASDGRIAALKVLREPPGDELRALARICHPAVVAVLEGGGHPLPHVVMELARGRPLHQLLRGRPAPTERVLTVGGALADALAAVHHAGLTHGDVKPENVIIGGPSASIVTLVDFGLAGASQGGSFAYAAPERTAGGPTSAAADVYALGLMLWEMLHGGLPWPELEQSEALLRRRSESPAITNGPPWLRELLGRMLAVDVGARPGAAEVADVFAANGVVLPAPDAAMLRRRSRSVNVPRAAVASNSFRWLKAGGLLAFIGPPGSGRTHILDALATELQARGAAWVRLGPAEHPWVPIEQALADPALIRAPAPLPEIADPADRAEAAAVALEERAVTGLWVLVDDAESLDDGTSRTLAALARRGKAALCVAGTSSPAWAGRPVTLEPFSVEELRALVSGVLGASGPLDTLISRLSSASGGLPGMAVELLLAAVRDGAVVRRNYVWVIDETRLERVLATTLSVVAMDGPLPEDAARLGAALAVLGAPAPLALAAAIAGIDEGAAGNALEHLVEKGLARAGSGLARVSSRAAANALSAAVPDLTRYHRAAIAHLSADSRANATRLGWHVIGAGDSALAESMGPASIRAALQKDPGEAARLADALWELAPGTALAAPRIEALISAGRAEEARAFGERFLDEAPLVPEVVPILIALGRVHTGFTRDDEAAMGCVARARIALAGEAPPWELLDLEAVAHFQAGRVDEAVRVSRAVAEQPPPTEPDRLDRWLTLRGILAQALERGGDLRAAINVLATVPEDLGRGRPARALLEAMHGRLLYHAGKIREAGRLMAAAAAEGSGLTALDRARNLNNAAICSLQAGDLSGAISRWEQALLLFERLDTPLEQVRVHVNLAVGYRESGRWDRARQSSEWAAERAAALGLPDLEALALGNLGDLNLARRVLDEAARLYDRVDLLVEAHGLQNMRVEQARRRAELAVTRDEPGALALAQTAERAAERAREEGEQARAAALVAVCLARAKRVDAVDRALARAMEPLKKAGAARELAEVRIWAAEAWLLLGRTEDALAEADRVSVYAEEGGHALLRIRAESVVSRARASGRGEGTDARLNRLLTLAVDVSRERDLPALLDRIADSARELLGADRAFVILDRTGSGSASEADLVVAAQRTREDVPPGPLSMSVVSHAIQSRREVIAGDVVERADLRSAQSVRAMHLRSVMCVPMVDGDQILGAIYVDSLTASEQELSEAARFLRGLAAFAAVAVTNARRLSDANQRAERAAEVAHDLSKPVGIAISITTDLLSRQGISNELRQGLDDVLVYTERALSLARSLLSERARPHRPLDLARLAARHVDELSREARRREISLRLDAPEPAWVKGELEDLGRALTNIISNALKYSPPQSEVLVRVTNQPGWVLCTVRDHGPGIPAESLPLIFDRGVQGSNALDGHGLGLAIARRVVAADHGGQIWAENAADGGAQFSMRLPALNPGRP